jgi:type II secretion system protein N
MERTLPKKAMAYVLWGLILAGILVLWKFPYHSLQQRLEAVARARWGLRLETADSSPTLPPGLRLAECSLRSTEPGSQTYFEATQVYIRLMVLPLLKGSLALAVRGQAYGGSLEGEVRLTPFYDVRHYRLKVRGQTIQLEGHPAFSTVLGRKLSGKISGEFNLEGPFDELGKSAGSGELQLMDGSFPVDSPYLNTKTLDDLELTANFELSAGIIEVSRCQFEGRGFQGVLSGKVKLQPGLSRSTLNLAGQGLIDSTLVNFPASGSGAAAALLNRGKPIPFKIRGTLAEPRLGLF